MLPTKEQQERIREAARALARAINEIGNVTAEIEARQIDTTNMGDEMPTITHTVIVRLTAGPLELY